MNEKLLRGGIAAVSTVLIAFLCWLIYLHPAEARGSGADRTLPALNATFNFLAASFLVAGWRAIKAGNRRLHTILMLSAVASSAMFLAGYVSHHYSAGDTPFTGQGWIRPVYFTILVTHILATTVALPMILFTLARASSGRFVEHRRIARWTLPLWLYASVTGVLIFALLRWWK
jgi:putative membrane protein